MRDARARRRGHSACGPDGHLWQVGPYASSGGDPCGFVVKQARDSLALVAVVAAPCSQVGNDPNPASGTCNNGDQSPANVALFYTLTSKIGPNAPDPIGIPDVQPPLVVPVSRPYTFNRPTFPDTKFRSYITTRAPMGPPNAQGDYWYMVQVQFQRLGGASNNAAARLSTAGQVEGTQKVIVGPTTLVAGATAQWRLNTSPRYDPRLYLKQWTLDGQPIGPNAGDSLIQVSGAAPGLHRLKLKLRYADDALDSVETTFQYQLAATVQGPSTVLDAGTQTWSAGSVGASGAQVTYQWQLLDSASGSWTSLGTASSASTFVSGSWPSPRFYVVLTVSANGYLTNTKTFPVANTLAGGCYGFYCALIPRADSLQRRKHAVR